MNVPRVARLPFGAALLFALAATVSVTGTRADFSPGYYTHGSCAGTAASRIDPINFVFWDWGTIDRSLNQSQTHSGWSDQGGSGQYFFDHGNCYYMAGQRASAGVASSRFHIRYHPIHSDANLGWTTIGDAHHEDFTYCGHAADSNGANGSGFDQGRRQLRAHLVQGGRVVEPRRRRSNHGPNTSKIRPRSCAGARVGSMRNRTIEPNRR